MDALDDSESSEVLYKDNRGTLREGEGVMYDSREHEGAVRGDPYVRATATAGQLGGSGEGEAGGEEAEDGGIFFEERVGGGHDFAVEERGAKLGVGDFKFVVIVYEVGVVSVVMERGGFF